MTGESHDVVIVGGGTAGCFAAATAAAAGLDVVLLERKTEEEAGKIACGDAIKGTSTFPDVIDLDYLAEESFANDGISRAIFENPKSGTTLDIPFGETDGVVLDRKRYGEVLLAEADRLGATIEYETVVNDVCQDNQGTVTGVRATRHGDSFTYEGAVTIDATGPLSILQERADLSDWSFDTNVTVRQYCSAYREIIEVDEPVDWNDAIVFRPTEELGYLWYFPRGDRTINAGLGFQMNKDPMELTDALRQEIEDREEFVNPTVTDKMGGALPTRRPLDSAVAPGFIAAGDSAGHVNPTTGGGIPGAAKAGTWAAEQAIEAIEYDDVSETALWEYNHRVMTDFGKRFAAMDLYNIWGSAHEVDELVDVITAMPGQQLIDALGRSGTASMGLGLKLRTLVNTFGHWGLLVELYKVHRQAKQLKDHYDQYPTAPSGLASWQDGRDDILDSVYAITGESPKY